MLACSSLTNIFQFRQSFRSFCQEAYKNLWFKQGLQFSCTKCGRCCTGKDKEPILLNVREAKQIADTLGIKDQEFIAKYTTEWDKTIGGQLQSKSDGTCIFNQNKLCSVYQVRPTQCKIYPFLAENLITQHDWEVVSQECPGIILSDQQSLDDDQNPNTKIVRQSNDNGTSDFTQRPNDNVLGVGKKKQDMRTSTQSQSRPLRVEQQRGISNQQVGEKGQMSQSTDLVPVQIATQLALIQELNRGQEFPEYDIIDFAESLEQLEEGFVDEWVSDVFREGQRKIIYEDDRFRVVDNFLLGHRPHRALLYRKSLAYSQTEVLLVKASTGWKIEYSTFCTLGHQCMALGIPLLSLFRSQNISGHYCLEQDKFECLVIGGAGCCLPLTLAQKFEHAKFVVVEIDEQIAQVAHTYFGAPKPNSQSQNVELLVDDGIRYLDQFEQERNFDLIFVDAAAQVERAELDGFYEHGQIHEEGKAMVAPPLEFLYSQQFWQNARKKLSCKGVLVVNLLGPKKYLQTLLQIIKSQFRVVFGVRLLNDNQLFVFCTDVNCLQDIDVTQLLQILGESNELTPSLCKQFIDRSEEVVEIFTDYMFDP